MPGRRSTARIKVDELLADHEWHTMDEVMAVAGPYILPGHAYRRSERNRLQTSDSVERIRGDKHTAIETGKRIIVVEMLNSMKHQNKIFVQYKQLDACERPTHVMRNNANEVLVNQFITRAKATGKSSVRLARETGISVGQMRKYLRGQRSDYYKKETLDRMRIWVGREITTGKHD